MKRILLFIFALLSVSMGMRAASKMVSDVLTSEKLGISKGNSYRNFSDKAIISDAVYAGQIAATNSTIQM